MGIIKVDLLGLGMMAVLEDCIKMIPEVYGETVDLGHLAADGSRLSMPRCRRPDTIGMFQVESRAQMSVPAAHETQRFYDVVVQVAIIRPGPIVRQNGASVPQSPQGRKRGLPAPDAGAGVQRTLGVPLFQEQLLRMAMIVAGSPAERRGVAPRHGLQAQLRNDEEIEVRCVRAGEERHHRRRADTIVTPSRSSRSTVFPESHAASFASSPLPARI
jgi:error-prone DNA polymerase